MSLLVLTAFRFRQLALVESSVGFSASLASLIIIGPKPSGSGQGAEAIRRESKGHRSYIASEQALAQIIFEPLKILLSSCLTEKYLVEYSKLAYEISLVAVYRH